MPSDDFEDEVAARGLNRSLVKHLVLTGTMGFVGALVLTSVLYEVTVSLIFAVLNAAGLLGCGVAMVLEHMYHRSEAAPLMTFVVHFGALVTVAAAAATLLVHFKPFGPVLDLAFIVGTCCGDAYALSYVAVTLFNNSVRHSTFVARQVYTIAAVALVIGSATGFFFAAADVEDHVARLSWDQWVCAAIGFFAGAAIGHGNYFAVDESMMVQFEEIQMSENVDE